MFPTVDLGRGKTFANLSFHITDLKKAVLLKGKKSFGPIMSAEEQSDSHILNNSLSKESQNLCTSLKNIPMNFPHF